ncbi:UNVERIFIED_CONTAM: hypothetical protein Sradi_3012600 [Sesamum radiatum]|uniref:Uncharacterized protein n=1 Tax=Sesamum radiatum TaxID=300843 RepID=A0AAW2S1E4_SESRA
MKSEEFVRRGLPQVKGSGPSGKEPSAVRRSQGVVPQMRKSLKDVGESLRGILKMLRRCSGASSKVEE